MIRNVMAVAASLVSFALASAGPAIAAPPARALDAGSRDAGPLATPDTVSSALRANVMIETTLADGRRSVGAGVIVRLDDGIAYVATGRHVVDLGFRGRTSPAPSGSNDVTVVGVDGTRAVANVEWLAPHGIDLAIVSAPLTSGALRAARWDRAAVPRDGDAVFAVGNPHGSGWKHTSGSLTQVRNQERDGHPFQILQAKLALAPGYSGGGLYDAEGRLIGINSLGGVAVGDPRIAGGIGFSVSMPTLLELAPQRFALSARPDRGPRGVRAF